MDYIWGSTYATEKLEKQSIRKAIILLLHQYPTIELDQLLQYFQFKPFKLNNFFRVLTIIDELESEGVIVKVGGKFKLAKITTFDGKQLETKKVCDIFYHNL